MSTALAEKPKTELAKAEKPKTLQDMLRLDAVKNQIAQALPKHCTADRFLRVVANSIRRVPALAECDQGSFFNALLTLSQYGLEPDGRNAHLIPFRNNKKGIVECQLIIDYKGLIELAMRSGLISVIHADLVCENDDFEYNLGEISRHKIDLRKPRGECYAVYALVKFKDGGVKCDVMTREDVEAIRRRSKSGNNGPWATDWNEMAKKTVFRRLTKWISISAEFRDAVDADDDVIIDATAIQVDSRQKADRLAARLTQSTDGQREPEPQKPDSTDLAQQNDPAQSFDRRIELCNTSTDAAQLTADIRAAAESGQISADERDELLDRLQTAMA